MTRLIALAVVLASWQDVALAQTGVPRAQGVTATVSSDAPIYISAPPAATLKPLRVAAVGSVLRALGETEEWLQVEFADPQYGPRIGWVQKKLVRVDNPALKPMDLSVPREQPKPPVEETRRVPNQAVPPRRTEQPRTTERRVGRAWIDINFIGLRSDQTEQAYVLAATKFSETATAATAYSAAESVKGASLDGGVHVGNNVGVGIYYSGANYKGPVGLAINVPHPLVFNRSASDVGATVEALKRQDRAFDFQVAYIPTISPDWRLRLFGGPTYFRVSQQMVGTIQYSQLFNLLGGNVVDITSYEQETVGGTTWGYNVGADVAFFFSRYVGAGGVLRLNKGTVRIEEPLTGDRVDLKLGFVTFGGGLRLRF